MKILGIHVSYNETEAIMNVSSITNKLRYAESKRPYIVRKAMIIKSLGLSQLIYQESVLYVPEGVAPVVKTKLERPLEKQERQNQKSSCISRPAER